MMYRMPICVWGMRVGQVVSVVCRLGVFGLLCFWLFEVGVVSFTSRVRVSVVISCKNRKRELLMTLRSINRSVLRDSLEVILIDDGSDFNQILDASQLRLTFPITFCAIHKEKKTWINPCIAYNLGLSMAKGEWIVVQNAGVLQVGDVPRFLVEKGLRSNYYAFRVFATRRNHTKLVEERMNEDGWIWDEVKNQVNVGAAHVPQCGPPNGLYGTGILKCWYCHQAIPGSALHFLTAIHSSILGKIGGFNVAFRDAYAAEDNELLLRVEQLSKVVYVQEEGLLGVHLWHPTAYLDLSLPSMKRAAKLGLQLLREAKKRPKLTFVNITSPEFRHYKCTSLLPKIYY